LTKGIVKLPDSKRKLSLQRWFDNDLLTRFSARTLPLDLDAMLLWGRLIGTLEPQGRILPLMDSLIAAIALQGSFTLVTRNEKDFAGTGLSIFNPWN
jgi:toxin FitB